jgi:hypothetical protein
MYEKAFNKTVRSKEQFDLKVLKNLKNQRILQCTLEKEIVFEEKFNQYFEGIIYDIERNVQKF